MFTGIVEEMGTIKELKKVSEQAVELSIEAEMVLTDLKIGDSIAVNGICLTVKDRSTKQFQLDVMPETMKATSLNTVEINSKVNLERAMPADGRFGGHFVSGHVDDTGEIIAKREKENAIYYTIAISRELTPFVILKGSIAVDGVSLTIFDHKNNTIMISLIPHTVQQTVLGRKGVGDMVNIECDMFAKYVQQMANLQVTKEN